MSDGRRNNGGHPNSGRKKGIGLTHTIRKHCEDLINELMKDESFKRKAQKEYQVRMFDEQEYFYIIGSRGDYKLGYTKNIKKRLSQYYTHNPDIQLLYLYKGSDSYQIERDMHSKYCGFRVSGEWFKLSESELIDIISTCSSRLVN